MTDVLFFGYYTIGTPYEAEVKTCCLSLDALGLKHAFIGIDSRGSWQKNTQAKAEIVRDYVRQYQGRRLVYLDVDSLVLRRPELFWMLDCDLAFVRFRTELLSGTLYLNANARTLDLCERWVSINRQYQERLPDGREAWDQRTLDMAQRQTPGLTVQELPQEYTYIVELTARDYPNVNPIILHTRGAFRFRKQMDGKN